MISNFERSYLEKLLQLTHGNMTRAAKEAKKDRRTFRRLVKKYHIEMR
jgi:DNA-binding NtrC family response regulator